MVTVESVETSVFLRGLVVSFPELWQRACNEAMVVLVPQVASLESESISLQSAEDHLLQRTPVAGEYVTVSGKRVTITGLTTVTTGHGFPEPVTARAMEVKRLSAGVREAGSPSSGGEASSPPPAGCTAMLVTRPLLGGVPAPMGSSDMDASMLRRLDAMLGAHSDAEAVFVALSEVSEKAQLAFERAGPMLPLTSLSPALLPPRQRARRWTFFSSVSGRGDDTAPAPDPRATVPLAAPALPAAVSASRLSPRIASGSARVPLPVSSPSSSDDDDDDYDDDDDDHSVLRSGASADLDSLPGGSFQSLTPSVLLPASPPQVALSRAVSSPSGLSLPALPVSPDGSPSHSPRAAGHMDGPFSRANDALDSHGWAGRAGGRRGSERRLSWATDGTGDAAFDSPSQPPRPDHFASGLADPLVALPPPARRPLVLPRLRYHPGRGFGCLDPPLDRLVELQSESAGRLLLGGSLFRGPGLGLGTSPARQVMLHRLQQAAECRIAAALRVATLHWLAVRRAAKSRRFCAGLAVLRRMRRKGNRFAAPPSCELAEAIRCDFGPALAALQSIKLALNPLEAKQRLRDCLREAEACVSRHTVALGRAGGSIQVAAEDKVAIAVHLLISGASDEVVAATVDVPAVVAAADADGASAGSPSGSQTGPGSAAAAAAMGSAVAGGVGRREIGAEAEVAVAAMQVAGGTESLLPFVSFGMALQRVADRSAAGMELDYAGATVMQAVAAICALAPWPSTPGEDIDEDVL